MGPNQIKHSLNGHAALRSRYKRLCICIVHTTIFIYNKKQINFGIGVTVEPLSRNESGRFGALKSDSNPPFL